jgi:hypothetical protein
VGSQCVEILRQRHLGLGQPRSMRKPQEESELSFTLILARQGV